MVLELGAGIGFISTYCAKRIGSERVFAVEANPVDGGNNSRNLSLNGVTPQLTCGLLGRGDGEETFYIEGNFISSSTLQRSASAQAVKTRRYDAEVY